jgi:hypothetical protein
MGADRALRDLIRPHLDAYYGHCFERLCREALPWLYRKEGITAPFEVGQYWSKTTQIDVVGLREDNWTDFGECKWGPVRSPQVVERERELEEKVRDFLPPGGPRSAGGSSRGNPRRRGRGGGGTAWRICTPDRGHLSPGTAGVPAGPELRFCFCFLARARRPALPGALGQLKLIRQAHGPPCRKTAAPAHTALRGPTVDFFIPFL